MTAEELYRATLEFNSRDDSLHQLIQRTHELLGAIEILITGLRALWDGEGLSEVERLRRRVAELEALLALEGK